MLAESVSKAASGEDLGVDDGRFEALIKDVNDDDDDELDGKRVYRRVSQTHHPHHLSLPSSPPIPFRIQFHLSHLNTASQTRPNISNSQGANIVHHPKLPVC